MNQVHITPVILCGGVGSRLWPLSGQSMPKQFISLVGERSCFQETVLRLADQRFAPAIIVTGNDYKFIVRQQLEEIGQEAAILLEPQGRNSGPAILAATIFALASDPNAVLLVQAADHVIGDCAAFVDAATASLPAAQSGKIVTFGISPDRPATGYGYIRPGAALDDRVHLVEAFVEKPDESAARTYLNEGYLWNSGNFMFRADAMMAEYGDIQPEAVEAITSALERAENDLGFLLLDRTRYDTAPAISIDYAVMEKTRHAAVIPVSYMWSDIGNWQALWEAAERDDDGNAVRGDVELLECSGAYVDSRANMLTTLVGVKDVAVIATDDAVLVVDRSRAQEVGALVDRLKKRNHNQATLHKRIYRPWGWYQTVDEGDRFQVKRIVVYPNGRLSLQKHYHRAEHWTVVHGTAEITVDKDKRILQENESTYIPLGAVHRLENPGKIDLELIEVQTGSYLGEDDIVRLDDVYARA